MNMASLPRVELLKGEDNGPPKTAELSCPLGSSMRRSAAPRRRSRALRPPDPGVTAGGSRVSGLGAGRASCLGSEKVARYHCTKATAHTISEFAGNTAQKSNRRFIGRAALDSRATQAPRRPARPRSGLGFWNQDIDSSRLLQGGRILCAIGRYPPTPTQATRLDFHHHGLISNHATSLLPMPVPRQHAAHPCGSEPALCTL